MLSCKKCGAQMSGIDLVCKNCGTPWGKKHKSRPEIYFSVLILLIAAGIAYLYYVPEAKENFFKFYNNLFLVLNIDKKNDNKPIDEKIEEDLQEDTNIVDNIETENPDTTIEDNPTPEDITPQTIEEIPPTFSWVSASSTLKDYPVENTTDGDLKTTWLEGVKGNGINEWVMYSSEESQKISSITLYNGYLKNDKVYLNNGRIKKLSIEFSDGDIITKDLEKVSFSEAKNGYTISLYEPKATTSVKLTILDAYQGSYYTDTGFSEIEFN